MTNQTVVAFFFYFSPRESACSLLPDLIKFIEIIILLNYIALESRNSVID